MGLILYRHCHLVVTTGHIKKTPGNFNMILFCTRSLTCCPVCLPPQIFGICLAQNLVSDVKAVKANWWPEGGRWGSRAPARSTRHTSRPSGLGWRTETRQHCIAAELSSTCTLSFIRAYAKSLHPCLSVTLESGEEYPTQTKQSTLCLPPSWILTLRPCRLQMLFKKNFLCASYDLFLWTIVFMGRSCTRTNVYWEIWSRGRKQKKKQRKKQTVSVSLLLFEVRRWIAPFHSVSGWTKLPTNSLFLTCPHILL